MFNLFKKRIHGAEVEMPLKGAFLVIQTQCYTNNGTWDLAPIYDCLIFDKEKIRLQKDNKDDEDVYIIKSVHCNETDSQVLYYIKTHERKTFLIIISTVEIANIVDASF